MRSLLAVLSAFFVFGASPALSGDHNCQCKAAGKQYELGQIVCLTLPSGQQLAQCGMVLNNSSWKKLQDGCPVSIDLSRMKASHGVPMTVATTALPDHSALETVSISERTY